MNEAWEFPPQTPVPNLQLLCGPTGCVSSRDAQPMPSDEVLNGGLCPHLTPSHSPSPLRSSAPLSLRWVLPFRLALLLGGFLPLPLPPPQELPDLLHLLHARSPLLVLGALHVLLPLGLIGADDIADLARALPPEIWSLRDVVVPLWGKVLARQGRKSEWVGEGVTGEEI